MLSNTCVVNSVSSKARYFRQSLPMVWRAPIDRLPASLVTFCMKALAKKSPAINLMAGLFYSSDSYVRSDLNDPARWRFDVAGLYAGQLFVELLGDRADLGFAVEHVQVIVVADAADWRNHGSGAASACFLEVRQFVDQHVAFDHFQAQTRFRQLDQRQTGDARQYRWRVRGDELVVVGDPEEVGRADFFDFGVGHRVQVDAVGKVRLLGLGAWHQAGGVVATDLGRAGALWGCAVEAGDQEVMRGQAALEVGTDRDREDREDELGSGAHADVVTHADNERTQVQRAASAIRRDETLVGADHSLAGFDELLGFHERHQQACATALHAQGVLVRAEQVDRAVLATIGLHAFEALLAIVKGSRAFADVQHVVFGQGAFVPGTITPVRQETLVCLDVVKAQLVPIDAFVTHDMFGKTAFRSNFFDSTV